MPFLISGIPYLCLFNTAVTAHLMDALRRPRSVSVEFRLSNLILFVMDSLEKGSSQIVILHEFNSD